MSDRRITVRLDERDAACLDYLVRKTGKTSSEVVRAALFKMAQEQFDQSTKFKVVGR